MGRTKSSSRWLQEHVNDPYVIKAQQVGYRSRAAFKLLEINQKHHLLRPGLRVVDLGAAPGGWSQVAAKLVGEKGLVVALDILEMPPLPNVHFIQGDMREEDSLICLKDIIGEAGVDVVLSDMAPNISGINTVDQARTMYLAEMALEMAFISLRKGGCFLVKVFQGAGFDELIRTLRQHFGKVLVVKPQASRSRSREIYLLAKEFINNN